MRRLADVFDAADEVRILGPGTDLTLSLAGRVGAVDDGHVNMPGGEVFYSPVEDSATSKGYPVTELNTGISFRAYPANLSSNYTSLRSYRTALTYVTDELLEDASLLTTVLNEAATAEINHMLIDAVIRGTGAGMPLGILILQR